MGYAAGLPSKKLAQLVPCLRSYYSDVGMTPKMIADEQVMYKFVAQNEIFVENYHVFMTKLEEDFS